MDTLASIFMLIGLVIGISSIFIDQYDIIFDPQGAVKEVIDSITNMKKARDYYMTYIKSLLKKIDLKWDCQTLYTTATTGVSAGKVTVLQI